MIDAHDTATQLLPGVAAKPPMPRRTNETQRKTACRYLLASKRPSCQRCEHVDARCHNTGSDYETQTMYCTKHRFNVGKHAVCQDYEGPR